MTASVIERDAQSSEPRADTVDDGVSISSWKHRAPIIMLAGLGFCIASYLAAYQMHLIRKVWDPVFGHGSEIVLRSFLSRLLPLPDAALGALGYAAEAIAAVIGGTSRWRTHSWFVCVYGGLVLCLAIVAVALSAIQVFVLHSGCTLCLCSAALSLIIASLASREVVAAWRNITHRTNSL
ncbi:MAG: vitamin K epoxide reductase family protein [Chthoniobacterales bacterium]